ncbi:MAG: hypothetical protein JSR78_07030 [Proteobacteria bacterium]|nr:hypothetical protein [Pseudomonadota bacterium]
MSRSIQETVPEVLKTLWELEKDLRSAAQNSVVLRRDEAKRHLADARRNLDALLSLVQNSRTDEPARSDERCGDVSDEQLPTPLIKH